MINNNIGPSSIPCETPVLDDAVFEALTKTRKYTSLLDQICPSISSVNSIGAPVVNFSIKYQNSETKTLVCSCSSQ